MKKLTTAVLVMTAAVAAVASAGTQTQPATSSVNGYVIDSACVFIKSLDKPISRECALKCAEAGSPLVILADDGTIYLPISGEMPAIGQNQRLIKFAGEHVTITGKVFERGGSHALIIDEIKATAAGR